MDEFEITADALDLTVGALVHSACPPGTFATHADEPLGLVDVLHHALRAIGAEGKLPEVMAAARSFALPRFERAISELEEARQQALRKNP